MIGAGWYAAQNHIPALLARPDIVLDGVCRKGSSELERVRSHFGFAAASGDHKTILARGPDIVVVASPHHLHFEHARDALLAGAHVLCEKPMTLVPAEAWELVRLARENGRHLLIANGYNYLPGVDDLRARLADGLIGLIEQATVNFVSVTRDVFLGNKGLDSWATSFFRPARETWQDPERGGGFAYGQMSHAIALLLFLTGLEPRSVGARTLMAGGVDIANSAALTLSNGAVASLSGAAAMPGGHRGLMRLTFAGARGVLTMDFDRDRAEISREGGVIETVPVAADAWRYTCTGPVDALVDLALGRGKNLSPGELGASTTGAIAAMLASAGANGAPCAVTGEAGA